MAERDRLREALAVEKQLVDSFIAEKKLLLAQKLAAERERREKAEAERDQLKEQLAKAEQHRLYCDYAVQRDELVAEQKRHEEAEAEAHQLKHDLTRHLSSIGVYPKEGDDLVARAAKAFAVEHERAKRAEAELEHCQEATDWDGTYSDKERTLASYQEELEKRTVRAKQAEAERDRLREQLRMAVEALETIIENRIADVGLCLEKDCECSECIARAALAAIEMK